MSETRSLKGPQKKLKLEVIDGKQYIRKRDLQHYFFDNHWTIKDFQYHFRLGHRIVRQSLYKWFTEKQIDASHREKIAIKQRVNNSNKVNWYRPRKVIPLANMVDAIGQCHNKKELKEFLNLTSFELSSLQQYYNLKLPNHNNLLENLSVYRMDRREIRLLAEIMQVMGCKGLLTSKPKEQAKAIKELSDIIFSLRIILRKLKMEYKEVLRKHKPHLPSNIIEYRFCKALDKLNINYLTQVYIEELNIYADFLLIDYSVILEIDGRFHSSDKDIERDSQLASMGYKVIRIPINKKILHRYTPDKDIRKCLKKYLLKVLDL